MNYKYLFICIVSILAFSSCEKKKEETLSSVSAPLAGGVWLSNCNYDGTAKGIYFDGSTYSSAFFQFDDSSCSNMVFYTERNGTFTTTSNSPQEPILFIGGHLNKVIEEYAITPIDIPAANSLNTASLCGLTNWASGTTVDVTGLDCGDGVLTPSKAEYDIYNYSVVTLSGISNAGDMLFGEFDSSHDGTSPSTRPEVFYGNYIFRKFEIEDMESQSSGSKLLQAYKKSKN